MKRKILWEIGIDEAGRGPLAGPVAVGVVALPQGFDWGLISGVGDSKKVTPDRREVIYGRARMLQKEGKLDFKVSLVHASTIDRIGITKAVLLGINRGLLKLDLDSDAVEVKLDGLLRAPLEYKHQETIIKGDSKELSIGLASILAKVTRDRYMVRMAKKYPKYGFEIHKGYGTKKHRDAIKKYGLSMSHRRSFCRSVQAE